MSELIDREATVKQICKMGEMLGRGHDRDVTIAVALFVQDDKTAFPTVDRPHGEWKKNNSTFWTCSLCGFVNTHNRIEYNFCPNCGADMRKEGDENG